MLGYTKLTYINATTNAPINTNIHHARLHNASYTNAHLGFYIILTYTMLDYTNAKLHLC